MEDEVVTIVEASTGRRIFGVGVLGLLGAVLLFIALSQPPTDLAWRFFLMGSGALALWMSYRMWEATQTWLELTKTQLRTSDGIVIAQIEDIKSVDRSTFAFKPSNGFILRLKRKGPRRWRPGLWWCLGRSVGVGGVTHAHQGKVMAEILSTMIPQR